jgi:hypothetical protein
MDSCGYGQTDLTDLALPGQPIATHRFVAVAPHATYSRAALRAKIRTSLVDAHTQGVGVEHQTLPAGAPRLSAQASCVHPSADTVSIEDMCSIRAQ